MKETPHFGAHVEQRGHSSFTLDWQSFGTEAAFCIGTLYKNQATRDPRFRKNVKNAQDMTSFLMTLGQESYYPEFPKTIPFTVAEKHILHHGESLILELPTKNVIEHIRSAVDFYRRSPNPHFQKKEKMALRNFSHGLAILESFVRDPWIRMELVGGPDNTYLVQSMATTWTLLHPDRLR